VSLLDEVLEHLLGHFEIRDHAVLHRSDRLDIARCFSEHFFCPGAHGLDTIGNPVDRDDRGLDHRNAASPDVDQGICGAEIDCKIGGKQPEQAGQVHQ